MMNRLLLIAGTEAAALAVTGCSDSSSGSSGSPSGENGDSTVTFSADLGQGYLAGTPAAADLAGTVNEVWAVPIGTFGGTGGEIYADFDAAVSVGISDGGFSLAVDPEEDWILLLMNTDREDRIDHIVAYVTLTDDTIDDLGMLLMPTSLLEEGVSAIDLETLQQEEDADDEARTPLLNEEMAENYRVGLDQLQEFASVDDTFRNIKNDYVNGWWHRDSEYYYDLEIAFEWQIEQQGVLTESTNNDTRATDPNADVVDWTAGGDYVGYRLGVRTTDPQWLEETLADTGWCPKDAEDDSLADVTVELVPPVDEEDAIEMGVDNNLDVDGEVTYSRDNPLSNQRNEHGYYDVNDEECLFNEGISVGLSGDDGDGALGFRLWGRNLLQGPVPEGVWKFRVEEDEHAWFDVAAGYPFNGDGTPVVYIPAPRFVLDETEEHIETIEIDWYRWDAGSGNYVAADLEAMARVTYGYGTHTAYYGDEHGDWDGLTHHMDTIPQTVSVVDMGDPPPDQDGVRYHDDFHALRVTYSTPGGSYAFVFRY